MPKKRESYPCCLVLPYRVTIFLDLFSQVEPYMTDSGRVYIEMTTDQIDILETGGDSYDKTYLFVKQRATECLRKDMTRAIERHEGIGSSSWAFLPSPQNNMFVMLESIEAELTGSHIEWKQREQGINFQAKARFCVTGEM